MTDQIVVETRNLKMQFCGVVAVNDIDLALRDGELRCLIGPNGAGKSTLFKCLTGQLVPTAGDILIRGTHTAGHEVHEIAGLGVGIKTQTPNLFEGLSADENIWIAARRRHGRSRARSLTEATLERFGLEDIASRAVAELAHGQRQWVELGMVMAAEPWLVLLDEPTAGMTQDEVGRTAELIRDLNRTATVIVVEHDMQFIRMIADIVTVLHEGRILIEDTMDNVVRNAKVREVYLGHRTT